MNSKIGNLAKPTPQIWDNEVATKQLNLNKLGDAGGPKDEDVRRRQKPIFEFICVYSRRQSLNPFLFGFFFSLFCVTSSYSQVEEIFNAADQKIIISTKRLQFDAYPGAFNPSLLKIESGFLLTFRYCPDPIHQHWISLIGIVELDDSLTPLSSPRILNTRPKRSKTPSQAEDARLFQFNKKIYLIYNDNIDEIWFSPSKRRDMFIAELILEDGQYRLSPPLKLVYPEVYTHQWHQKNWVPFQWKDNLLFSYSLNPHQVLVQSNETGSCCSIYKTEMPIPWIYGPMRGSSSAEKIGEEYLAFFHSSIKTRSPYSPELRTWHYFMGAYTFSSSPPFELTKISAQPILAENFYTYFSQGKQVILPGGFAIHGDVIYIAYGRGDQEIWIATLDKDLLIKSLIPLGG